MGIDSAWASSILVVALAITLVVLAARRDIAYGAVIVWALVGIAANQGGHPGVVETAEASIFVATVMILAVIVLSSVKTPSKSVGPR